MDGSLLYVMGPSGAGKDSVLGRARALLPSDAPVVFAHRYITRPADTGGENHVAVTRAEFAMRRDHGLFAYHWGAHGNDYGVGREIHDLILTVANGAPTKSEALGHQEFILTYKAFEPLGPACFPSAA